jgi:hypothetical protein
VLNRPESRAAIARWKQKYQADPAEFLSRLSKSNGQVESLRGIVPDEIIEDAMVIDKGAYEVQLGAKAAPPASISPKTGLRETLRKRLTEKEEATGRAVASAKATHEQKFEGLEAQTNEFFSPQQVVEITLFDVVHQKIEELRRNRPYFGR